MEQTVIFGYLNQHIAGVMHRQSDQILQERLGIGISQFKLLRMFGHHSKMQQRQIADRLGQTEASISRQIKVLCDKGLLSIEVNPASRREHITRLTPKGSRLSEVAQEILVGYYEPVLTEFSEKERKQMLELLQKMHQMVCQPGKPHSCDHLFDGNCKEK